MSFVRICIFFPFLSFTSFIPISRLGIAIVTIDLTDCTSPLPRGAIGSQTASCAHSSTTNGVSEQTSLNSVRDVRAVVNNSNNNNNSNCANSSTGNSRGSVDRQIAIQKVRNYILIYLYLFLCVNMWIGPSHACTYKHF